MYLKDYSKKYHSTDSSFKNSYHKAVSLHD